MAKIYYDPDNDELIPISKSKSARSKVSSADADDISERLERIEAELKSLNGKADRTQDELSNQAAFALGAYAGWKFVDDVCDSVKSIFDTGCGNKKKWL